MLLKKIGGLLSLLLLLGCATAFAENYGDWFVFQDGATGLYDFVDREATETAMETGILSTRKDGKAGWITLSGEEKCAPIWDFVYPYLSEDGTVYVKVRQDRLWGVADIDGNLLIEPLYAYVGFFSESLIPVQKGQKWGYLDEEGEVVLPFAYQDAQSFVDGVAWVQQDGGYFTIDRTGQRVDPPSEDL